MVTDAELCHLRHNWYSHPIIQYNLISLLKGRELAILPIKNTTPNTKARYIKAFHTHFLNLNFKTFNVLKYPNLNLYCSLAQLSWIPTASFNLKSRYSEEEYVIFGEEYDKYITGYDILFDIDAHSIEEAYPESVELKKILDEERIAYSVYCSGNKGFHIRIPYECTGFNNNTKFTDEFRIKIANFIYYVKQIYGFKFIDTSIVDYKRIAKLPYSLVRHKVVLPLDDKQFGYFKVSDIEIQNIDINSLRNRGLLTRKHERTDEQLGQNFQRFFKEFQE